MKLAITLLLLVCLSSACTSRFLGKYYAIKVSEVSAEITMHGIEMECFKFENKRWPHSFSEMMGYEPKVLPCIGLSVKENRLWETYPTALVEGIDDRNALIIIKEKQEQGELQPFIKPLHINYTVEYQRSFERAD